VRFPGHAGGRQRVDVVGVGLVGVELQMLHVGATRIRSRQNLIHRADMLEGELAIVLDVLDGREEHIGDLLFAPQLDGTIGVFDFHLGSGGKGTCGGRAGLGPAEGGGGGGTSGKEPELLALEMAATSLALRARFQSATS